MMRTHVDAHELLENVIASMSFAANSFKKQFDGKMLSRVVKAAAKKAFVPKICQPITDYFIGRQNSFTERISWKLTSIEFKGDGKHFQLNSFQILEIFGLKFNYFGVAFRI